MKTLRLGLAALVALCAAACLPVTTKTPVGLTAGFVNDPALEGLWIGKVVGADPQITYFHLIANSDDTITVIGVTPSQGKNRASWGTYSLTTSTLGGHDYMNARETSDDGKPAAPDKQKTNIPVLYTLGTNTLSLYLLDEKNTAAAIAAHRIEGTVHKDNFGQDVAITADAAHLDAFLKSPDAPALFKLFMVLKKMK